MRLPFLRSKDPAPERRPRAAVTDDAKAVEAARTRARRRLTGAGVLLLAGVIGFPMLFETQPRPLPADTPIQVRPRDIALAPAAVPAPAITPSALPVLPDAGADAPAPVGPGETAAEAGTPVAAAPPAPAVIPAVPAPAEPSPPVPAAALPEMPAPRPDDGARARALLEGRASASAEAPAAARFVVQAGAYSDPATLRSARQRVERLGLKTYIQVVDTAGGKRTRVRVGPYASRDEADAAAARIKGAGLPAAVLVL